MNAIDKWYEIMKNKDSDNLAKLDDLLDDDVVFFPL